MSNYYLTKLAVKKKPKVNYSKMTGEEIWNATKNLGAEDLGDLKLTDKIRAIKGQATQADWSPKGIAKGVWNNLGEAGGGGGYSGGSGTLARHLPVGAKLTVASMGVPSIASGFAKEDAEGLGRSRTERFGKGIGLMTGAALGYLPHSINRYLGVAALPVSIGASIGGSILGEKAGGAVGRFADKHISRMRGVGSGDIMAQKFQKQQNNKSSGVSQ